MRGLLIKDFRLMKNQGRSLIIIVAVAVAVNLWIDNYAFIIAYLGFIGVSLAMSTITYDEYDNGNAFLFSLPITPKEYAAEKYIFSLLFVGGAWLIGTVGGAAMQLAKEATTMGDIFAVDLMLLPALILILAIMLPFQLKFGAEKGRIIRIVVLMLGVGIIAAGVQLAEMWNLSLSDKTVSLPVLNTETVGAIGAVLAAAVLYISWKISVSIMKKKEF